jgi:hypothetical protein
MPSLLPVGVLVDVARLDSFTCARFERYSSNEFCNDQRHCTYSPERFPFLIHGTSLHCHHQTLPTPLPTRGLVEPFYHYGGRSLQTRQRRCLRHLGISPCRYFVLYSQALCLLPAGGWGSSIEIINHHGFKVADSAAHKQPTAYENVSVFTALVYGILLVISIYERCQNVHGADNLHAVIRASIILFLMWTNVVHIMVRWGCEIGRWPS